MCNLYRLKSGSQEVAGWFDAVDKASGANYAADVFPGYPGLVIADGAVRSMVWGFPLPRKGKQGQALKPKPVNNARSDKLGSFFWRYAFEERRCLIPLSAWAEAEGPKGRMTRSWLSLPDSELFAVAGVWRQSDEWGESYAMVMTEAGGDAAAIHSRMPVILAPGDYTRWTEGTPDDARALCRSWPDSLAIERTDQPWFARKQA